MLLLIERLNKSFGTDVILENIDAKIEDRDRIGLIGVNGAGKTTLLNIMNGDISPDPDGGRIALAGKARVGFLHQDSGLDSKNSIIDEMKSVFAEVLAMGQRLGELTESIAAHSEEGQAKNELLAEYARLDEAFIKADGYLVDVKINTILNGMGFADKAKDTAINTLSGGEKTRLAIAKLLLEEPNLLILDEPTNHLDFKTLTWLEGYLAEYKGALLVVSHDRYFLDKLVTTVWEVENHHLYTYKGNYTKFVQLKAEKRARQQKEYDMQQKEIASMEDFVARNLVRASTTKRAQSRIAALDRMQRVEKPLPPPKVAHFHFDYATEPVRDVLVVENLSLSVGEGERKKQLAQNVNLHLFRGQKIAIIGENGVGKSTFLKVLLDLLPAQSGQYSWGRNVKTAYYEQELKSLNPRKSALDEVWSAYPRLSEYEVRSILGRVLLSGENAYKPVSVLSGGEKAKLAFALLMLKRGNVLLLDEPTNHLDLQSKEALEETLMKFGGTLLMVSHDRYMLNRVSDFILEFTKDGVALYQGGYDAYLSQKAGTNEAVPDRTKKEETQERPAAHRGRQKRSQDAKYRQQMKEMEEEIAFLEEQVALLETEITEPDIYENYQVLQEKCAMLEESKGRLADTLNRWIVLSENKEEKD